MVAASGVDAIGLVFYPDSPRMVTTLRAAEIADALPPFISLVGLFVNAQPETVESVVDRVPLTLLQFHGDETAADCTGFGLPYIKAVRMRPETDLSQSRRAFRSAAGLLLDAWSADLYGGTGKCFDWSRVPADRSDTIILAGGLNADNVGDAIRRVHPYAVDVSGGVEAAKGVKDPTKVASFVAAVRSADTPPPDRDR